MTGAGFILAINLFVGGLFASAFITVAVYEKTFRSARWLAFAYFLGMINITGEFIVPSLADARPVLFISYAAFLGALLVFCVGVALRYQVEVPWRLLGNTFGICLLLNLSIQDMERDSLLRMALYQAPFFIMQAICARTVYRSGARHAIDVILMGLLIVSSLHFMSKPFLALAFGGMGPSPQAYLTTRYALFSQSMGTVLAVTTGMLMLFILTRDILLKVTARSETDTLSGLLNRRGFEERAKAALAGAHRSGAALSLVICDIDHFKQINDTHGHVVGDRVIARFGALLAEAAGGVGRAGRIGGEEFAILLPNADSATARLFCEGLRVVLTHPCEETGDPPLAFTASFGVADRQPGEDLFELLNRADEALYRAKRAGRDRVAVAERREPAPGGTASDPAMLRT